MPDTLPEANVSPNIAPNIDSELDSSLSKAFPGMRPQDDAAPIEKPAQPEQPKGKEAKATQENINQPDVKPEQSKAPEKPVEKEKPILTPDDVEKIDPKDKGAWGAIKNSNKRAHSMIEQRDAEIVKLKSTIAEKNSASQKELEALKAELEDTKKYRAMVEIEADPEFISNFDKPIEAVVSDIKSFLKQRKVGDEVIQGLNLNDTKLMSQLIGIIDKEEGELSASELRGKIREYLDLSRKRTQTISEQKNNYKETLEKKKQEAFSRGAEAEGRMIKHIELKSSENNKDGNALIPFLRKQEPKENATQFEIDATARHNSLVDEMNGTLQKVLKMKEPEQQAEIAIAAVASHYLNNQLKAVTAQLVKAQEELKKISNVTTEAPSRKPAAVSRNGNGELVTADKALEDFWANKRK